jgi:transcriptional regulator with XRE-family HTH domain
MKIGPKIKQLVEERRINKADFARQLDMSEQNLYKIFKKSSVDTELLIKVSQLLGVGVLHFFENAHLSGPTDQGAFVAEPAEGYGPRKFVATPMPEDVQAYIRHLEHEVTHLRELNQVKDELIAALKRK